jgi:hypothetical protein
VIPIGSARVYGHCTKYEKHFGPTRSCLSEVTCFGKGYGVVTVGILCHQQKDPEPRAISKGFNI